VCVARADHGVKIGAAMIAHHRRTFASRDLPRSAGKGPFKGAQAGAYGESVDHGQFDFRSHLFSRQQGVGLPSVNPKKLLKNLDELLRRTFGGLIHPQCDVAPDIWPVFVDPLQLEVAVLNLDDAMGPTLPGVSRLRQMTQCRWGRCALPAERFDDWSKSIRSHFGDRRRSHVRNLIVEMLGGRVVTARVRARGLESAGAG
jgi:hypothetical protein